MNIKLSKIKPNPFQVRQDFDKDKIKELADSIKVNGLLQPIGVREANDGYQIVFGERRYRAIELLGYEYIECNIMDIDDKDMFVDGLIENIVREDIDEIEKANGLYELFSSAVNTFTVDESNDDTVSSLIKKLYQLDNDIQRNKPIDKELNNLCNQVGKSPRRIVDYLKISTLDDDLKLLLKNKTKQSLLEVNKFLTDTVKFFDEVHFEQQKVEQKKIEELKTFEANKDKPIPNSLVGGSGGQSVYNYVKPDGTHLNDNVKYPNLAPNDKPPNEPFIYQQYNTDIDKTLSNKHTKIIDEIKTAYKKVGNEIDSKELSRRTNIAAKTPIEYKAAVIENKQTADIIDKLNENNYINDHEFVDKVISKKPNEKQLVKIIEKHKESEKPKEIITAEQHNNEAIEKQLTKIYDRLNDINNINIAVINNCSKDQLNVLKDKIENTIKSLNDKVKQIESQIE